MLQLFVCFLLLFQLSNPQDDQGFSCVSYKYLGERELGVMASNCTDVYGHVWIFANNADYSELMRVFSRVKNIVGCISVHNTDFKDLAFFGSLENVTCAQNQIQAMPMNESFGIINNPNLMSLKMKNIKKITGPLGTISGIFAAHSNFCITADEWNAISLGSYMRICDQPVCFRVVAYFPVTFWQWRTFHSNGKLTTSTGRLAVANFTGVQTESFYCIIPAECDFGWNQATNGSQIPINCTIINWPIDLEGDIEQKYLDRLKTVKLIAATFTMKDNNEIETLDLRNLKYITLPEDSDPSYGDKNAITFIGGNNKSKILLNPDFTIIGSCKGMFIEPGVVLEPNSTYATTNCELLSDNFNGEYDY